MINKTINRRHELVVDKTFQYRFIVRFILMVLLTALLSLGALYWYINYTATVTTVFNHSRLAMMSTADFIFPSVIFTFLVVVVVVGSVALLIALFQSHRIAGPAYRIIKDLQELAAGKLTKVIRLREHDELIDITQAINCMTRKFRKDIAAMKEAAADQEAGAESQPLDALEQLRRIRKILDQYNA